MVSKIKLEDACLQRLLSLPAAAQDDVRVVLRAVADAACPG